MTREVEFVRSYQTVIQIGGATRCSSTLHPSSGIPTWAPNRFVLDIIKTSLHHQRGEFVRDDQRKPSLSGKRAATSPTLGRPCLHVDRHKGAWAHDAEDMPQHPRDLSLRDMQQTAASPDASKAIVAKWHMKNIHTYQARILGLFARFSRVPKQWHADIACRYSK